jgi:hypothetical protein
VRVEIAITVDRDRLRCAVLGTAVDLDEPNRVAVSRNQRGRITSLLAVGRATSPEGDVVPAYDATSFDPDLSSSVIEYMRQLMWSRARPPLIGMFDRLVVRLNLANYDDISEAERRHFERRLSRFRTRWYINGTILG